MYSVVTQQIETENNHQIQCLPKTGAHQNGNWKFFARKVIVCNLDYRALGVIALAGREQDNDKSLINMLSLPCPESPGLTTSWIQFQSAEKKPPFITTPRRWLFLCKGLQLAYILSVLHRPPDSNLQTLPA